jgi:hypothetical protein
MCAYFSAISAKELYKVQDDPGLLDEFLYPDNDEGEPEFTVDVDKAWHGLHYIFAGQAGEAEGALAQAILGGEVIGEDQGMGPARFLTPEQVKETSAALNQLTIDEFTARYKPIEMTAAEIYPEIIWERDGEEALDYLLEYFQVLTTFYHDTAVRGDGMILVIS